MRGNARQPGAPGYGRGHGICGNGRAITSDSRTAACTIDTLLETFSVCAGAITVRAVATLDPHQPEDYPSLMRRDAGGTNPVLHCPLYFIVRFNVTPGYSERPDVSAIATETKNVPVRSIPASAKSCIRRTCSQAPRQIPQRPHSPGRLT